MGLYLLIGLIFCTNSLFGQWPSMPSSGLLTSLEGEPSAIVDGCLNVISGEFVDHEVDLTIAGPEPLTLERVLLHNNPHPLHRSEFPFWQLSHESRVRDGYSEEDCAEYLGPLGEYLNFKLHKKSHIKIGHINKKILKYGFTNTSKGAIGAQTNIRNNTIFLDKRKKRCNILTSDGSHLHFACAKDWGGADDEDESWECYKITKEYHPNQLRISYDYNKHYELQKKTLKNSAGAVLAHYTKQFDKWVDTYTSIDGRIVKHQFRKVFVSHLPGPDEYEYLSCLMSVERSDGPRIKYDYSQGREIRDNNTPLNDPNRKPTVLEYPKVIRKSYPDHRFLHFLYYQKGNNIIAGVNHRIDQTSACYCRISHIFAPLGTDATPIPKYQLVYYLPDGPGGKGCTGVYDAKLNKTNYTFNSRQRLKSIVKYHTCGTPYTIESLYWGPKSTPQEIELKSRAFQAAGKPYLTFCRHYTYTAKGNIQEERLFGNLTGKREQPLTVDAHGNCLNHDCECLIKAYSYTQDDYNLLTHVYEGPRSTRFSYVPNTNLISACYHLEGERIYQRNFYDYDENGMVIRHILDDGTALEKNDLTNITHRKIESTERSHSYPAGLPLNVTETCLDPATGAETFILRKRNTYDMQGRLICQETYDAANVLAYAEAWSYDAHSNLIKHVSRLGLITTYAYDANDNKIFEQGPNPLSHKRFAYDFMNRLIREEEVHSDGVLTKHYRYDLCGNQISAIDAFGNETRTDYDEFNRPIAVIGAPLINIHSQLYNPITRYEYDELSRPTKIIDASGQTTEFAYTLYGKPYFIRYPDGSEEHFEYDLEGRLVKEVAKNGTATLYTLDVQGRIVRKQVLSAAGEELLETTAGYDAFHLLWEKDPAGVLTTYTYDTQGRKISAQREGHVIHYGYDSLGRLNKTIEGSTVKAVVYDQLNRVAEERTETLDGQCLTSIRYGYDLDGNKNRIEQNAEAGLAITEIHYNTHGVPELTIDPCGNKSYCRLLLDYVNVQGGKKDLKLLQQCKTVTILIRLKNNF